MNTNSVEVNTPDENANLVEVITALLIKHGHSRPQDWLNGLHQDAFATQDQNIQRFLINRYWRNEISKLQGINTMDIRYCLVDNGDIKDWLRLFETGVLPCIVQHNLPPAIN